MSEYKSMTDDDAISTLRQRITQHNTEHPKANPCIAYGCQNKVESDSWDNKVLCIEHDLLFRYWFYELDGAKYCPETWNLEDFGDPSKMLPKSKEADIDMKAYRKRYCDWIQSLSPEEYKRILLWSIK